MTRVNLIYKNPDQIIENRKYFELQFYSHLSIKKSQGIKRCFCWCFLLYSVHCAMSNSGLCNMFNVKVKQQVI